MKKYSGFTLVEMMVVVSVIGILVTAGVVSFNQGSAQSRDAERKADLRTLQAAIELYKEEYGRYPEGCNPVGGMVLTNEGHWEGVWSGQPGSGAGYECDGGVGEYIVGLAPEFIPVLPTDPKLNNSVANSGYAYVTNPEGTVFKVAALNTVETETVDFSHPFARCGDVAQGINSECDRVANDATGNLPYNTVGGRPNVCDAPEINNDYAVWGGYAPRGYNSGSWRGESGNEAADIRAREFFSDSIRCK